MRCSSCEPLLDRYVEGTLNAREMIRVGAHLRACSRCEALLTELRVVDALLATTTPVELAPNFTFAVMAEVGSLPARRTVRRPSAWAWLSFYLIGAWIALSVTYAALGGRVPYVSALAHSFSNGASQALTTITGAAQGFSPAAPLVVGGVVGVLSLDALLAIGAVIVYRAARSRLAAHLQRSEAA